MNNYMAIIIFVIFNGIGFVMLRKAMIIRRIGREASKWPTVNGLILESEIVEDQVRSAMGSVNNSFILTVKYQYTVDGKQYEGDRLSFGSAAFNYITASNVREQFAQGKEAPVYYNPKDPDDCALAPKTTNGMPSMIPGIFLICVGVLIPLYSLLVLAK